MPASVERMYPVPAAAAARAASTSPFGKSSRVLPMGASRKGSEKRCPSTVVSRLARGEATAPRGRKSTSSKTETFERSVLSASAPPST